MTQILFSSFVLYPEALRKKSFLERARLEKKKKEKVFSV